MAAERRKSLGKQYEKKRQRGGEQKRKVRRATQVTATQTRLLVKEAHVKNERHLHTRPLLPEEDLWLYIKFDRRGRKKKRNARERK